MARRELRCLELKRDVSRMKSLVAAAVLSLALAPAAFAQPDAPNTSAPAARFERTDTADQMRTGRAANPNDRVCRAITATGSRLGARRECRTRAEWAERAGEHRESTDQAVRDSLRGTTIANTGGG